MPLQISTGNGQCQAQTNMNRKAFFFALFSLQTISQAKENLGWSYFKVNRDSRADTRSFLTQGPSHCPPSKRTSSQQRVTVPWLPGALLGCRPSYPKGSHVHMDTICFYAGGPGIRNSESGGWEVIYLNLEIKGISFLSLQFQNEGFALGDGKIWKNEPSSEKENSAGDSSNKTPYPVVLLPVSNQRNQKVSCTCTVFLLLRISENSNRKSWLMRVVWAVKLT